MCENNVIRHELKKWRRIIGAMPAACARLQLYRDINERQRGAAERFIFAENQCQIALNTRVRQGERGQRLGLQVFRYVGARYEPDSDVGCNEALQQLAGVQFHGYPRLQTGARERASPARRECGPP